MGVFFTHKGDLSKATKWLDSLQSKTYIGIINRYGQMGVDALRKATPVDTGLAANSWKYHIEYEGNSPKLVWENDDIEGGCSVVVLIDRGHATKSGGWVAGKHFIEPALEPIIKQLSDEVWKEVTG